MARIDLNKYQSNEFAKSDPILRFFTKFDQSPLVLSLIFVISFNLIRLIVAILYGQARTRGQVVGYFDDPGQYTIMLYGITLWYFYIWIPRGIASVFRGLHLNKVIKGPKKGKPQKTISSYEKLVESAMAAYAKWWLPAISLVVAIVVFVAAVLPGYLSPVRQATDWAFNNLPSHLLTDLWMILGIYAVVMFILYCLLSIHWLGKLFSDFDTRIRPLHPDKAGGLSPLGNFTLSLTYLIAISGAFLVVIPITRDYVMNGSLRFEFTHDIIIGLVAYLVLAPIAFFAPLSVAHNSMLLAKEQLLLQIDGKFEEELTQLQNSLEKDKSTGNYTVQNLKDLQVVYETVRKFPVWPFNTESLTRFSTTYLTPIALAVLANLLGRIF